MSRGKALAGAILLFGAAAVAGFFLAQQHPDRAAPAGAPARPGAVRPVQAVVGALRPEFKLPDLNGQVRQAAEWNGRVLAINFWATWCPPCRKEIPEFVKLQEKYGSRGLQFIGIALEQPDTARVFAEEFGVNYPVLAGTVEVIKVAEAYGNVIGALPFTAVVDRSGRISFVRAGPLSGDAAEKVILPLL